MRARFGELVHKANLDDDVKVLVIRGEGDNLGSGGDLNEHGDLYLNPKPGDGFLVDLEIVNYRFHGERQSIMQFSFGFPDDLKNFQACKWTSMSPG